MAAFPSDVVSQQIVLSSTLPVSLTTPLRQLFFESELNDKGFLSGAVEQAQIVAQHAGFLHDELTKNNFAEARRHAEHVVNILEGEGGFTYGDLNRDGQTQNPGDGFGLLVYLRETESLVGAGLGTLDATIIPPAQLEQVESMVTTLANDHALAAEAVENTVKVFASDTVTEAQAFADELRMLVGEIRDDVANVYTTTLQLAEYRFYAQPSALVATSTPTFTPTKQPTATKPPTATATKLPTPTATNTVTPTLTNIATPSATNTVAPTATKPPTPTATSSSTATATKAPTATNSPTATKSPTPTATNTATKTSTPIPTAARPAPTATDTATPLPTVTPTATRPTIPAAPVVLPLNPTTGVTWTNPVDGAVYVYVPGGEFTMGSDPGDGVSPQEQPAHTATAEGFWMQQTEVTNAQYARCVAAGVCTPPANDSWEQADAADLPVTHVDWTQANTYAAWTGGRLPSEAEWEHACRNDDARLFPWGDEPPTAERANFNNNVGEPAPVAVGSYPAGASPYGVLDLSGNVWEWTSSLELPYPYAATDGREDPDSTAERTLRGGSFYYTQYQLRCTTRSGFTPDTANQHFGLRVVASPSDSAE